MSKESKALRRIKFLVYKYNLTSSHAPVRERLDTLLGFKRLASYMKREELLELKRLLDTTFVTQQEMIKMSADTYSKKSTMNRNFQKPILQRDNKGVRIGGGGSNYFSVRYPSKKRSLRTWKIFYEMFPYEAEKDNWDGKTSDKMTKKP